MTPHDDRFSCPPALPAGPPPESINGIEPGDHRWPGEFCRLHGIFYSEILLESEQPSD